MWFSPLSIAILLALASIAHAADPMPHGEDEKDEMGPVAFMWPPDRVWNDDNDNTGPCGSVDSPSNRTDFPLINGAVALTIQDDAWDVALRIAYKDNPTLQRDFKDIVPAKVSAVEAGHQCYALSEIPRDVEEDSKATIQLEYWAIDDDKNISHYACADINFVPVSQFKTQVPCFNVTSKEFAEKPKEESAAGALGPASVATAIVVGMIVMLMV